MITCRRASELASQAHDRELGRFERVQLRTHLWICSHCRRMHAQLEGLGRLQTSFEKYLGRHDMDGPSLSEDARARMVRAFREPNG